MTHRLRTLGLAVPLAVVAPAVALLVLAWNGALTPPPVPGLPDPSPVVSYGLPVLRALRDIGAAVTLGALVLAATVVPPAAGSDARRIGGSRTSLLNVAAAAGSVWVWCGLGTVVLTYGDVVGADPFAPGGTAYLGSFLSSVEIGRALLLSAALAALAAVGSLFARTTTATGLLALTALVALWPQSSTGHAAGGLDHEVAVNSQMAHLVGVSLWVGGLVTLLLVQRRLTPDTVPTVVRRYSRLAGWAAGLAAASGIVSALLRLSSWSDLGSPYGLLILAKSTLLVLLLAAGAWHRRSLVTRFGTGGRGFLRLALAEVTVMAVAIGLGVALSRTPPPPGKEAANAAEVLLGHALPPALDVGTFLSQWYVDTFWAPLAVFGIVAYLLGVRRLRSRGDSWPLGRTLSWLAGMALLVWATSGSPGVYGDVLFSMHMVQHMTIATATPAFLVLGAPASLALRTIERRSDGTRGPREWLLLLVHSRFLAVLGHPVVAAALFVISLVVFYSSSLFELSLRSHTVHLLMVFHFLLTGYLLASAMCGVDPGPRRAPYPLRLVVLMVTFGFHALFSVSLMNQQRVLAEDWFTTLGRTWGKGLLEDQYAGATLGWVLGDYPLAVLGFALVYSWVRSDMRDARRMDRRVDRGDDSERTRYNEELRRLHQRR